MAITDMAKLYEKCYRFYDEPVDKCYLYWVYKSCPGRDMNALCISLNPKISSNIEKESIKRFGQLCFLKDYFFSFLVYVNSGLIFYFVNSGFTVLQSCLILVYSVRVNNLKAPDNYQKFLRLNRFTVYVRTKKFNE